MANHFKLGFFLIAPVIIGLTIFIFQISNENEKNSNFDELALGQETKTYYAAYQGSPVHCGDLTDGDRCLVGWKQRGEHPVTLWLGNSQLHAINQMKPNDVNGVQILHGMLAEGGNELLSFSEANANLQEHYVLFQYLKSRLPIRTLLLPTVFDDTRETGLRDELIPALDEPEVRDVLSETEIGRQVLAESKSEKSSGDLSGLNNTPQKNVESTITSWLTEHWPLWETRPKMRGQLFTSLYQWRNSVFGISAQSKRKIIPGRYVKNLDALKAILQTCAEEKIHVIVYIVPLRRDIEAPYVAKEYAGFKKDVEALANAYGVVFANLEGLVPGELWGRKDATSADGEAELDFMHFQAGGHHLLAQAMYDLLQENYFLDEQQ